MQLFEFVMLRIYPKGSEMLHVTEVIEEAPLFELSTSKYNDSTEAYFAARSKDKRSALQFEIANNSVRFQRSVMSAL